MQETEALFAALRPLAQPDAVRTLERLIRDGADEELSRINPCAVAADSGVPEDVVVGALLHAVRLGLFEMSWNILCPHCSGVLNSNATLKTVRESHYFCAFCEAAEELRLDDRVEVTFTVSPRVRRIAAHDPGRLGFWDYHRQVFFGSGVAFPKPEASRRSCPPACWKPSKCSRASG